MIEKCRGYEYGLDVNTAFSIVSRQTYNPSGYVAIRSTANNNLAAEITGCEDGNELRMFVSGY